MASALNVAKCFIKLAAAEDEPEYLCHLRLQKLLYYAQGWSLALYGKPMFPDRIEAWANGPVVRNVYPAFADYGSRPIPPEDIPGPQGMTKQEAGLVESVWNAYKQYSAISLRDMTHEEPPWRDARGNAGPADRSNAVISNAALRGFFDTLEG